MNRPCSNLLFALACLTVVAPAAGAQAARLDSLDAFVKSQMAQRHIRGLSLAIIKDGKIAIARAYGVVDDSSKAPVTTSTLFQAGSISKPVSALGALHLVETGTLSLDADVNTKLTSWKVPDNQFTSTEKVTLRRLLSHNAGLTVHGFPGYDVSARVPTVVQVLDGAPPANTAPIRVDTTPGAIWRYSGGGFTVMQQMVIDMTGQPYAQFLQKTVLGPIGMTSSSFEQPLPNALAAHTAAGYYADGSPVRGRWHVYPEIAAAGLWTTPTDLAKWAIEVQETLAGRGHGVISPAMARQFVTEQKGGSGLGVGVQGTGASLRFSHGGRDEGFDAFVIAGAETGDGLAIMINANDNSRMVSRIQGFIERSWAFKGTSPANTAPSATTAVRIDRGLLTKYAGYYEASENNMVPLVANPDGSGMQVLVDGLPDEKLLAIDSTTFGSNERAFRVRFSTDARGTVTGATVRPGEPREVRAPRVAPLPSALQPHADPDPALATRISAALAAIHQGGDALANAPDVTPGAKKDFTGGTDQALGTAGTATYVGDEDVTGRGIRRHGGEVARVRLYRLQTKAGQRYLLVHLTSAGAVTDYDVVTR
ncbi:MAG TPA: serine hydrolase domain-containing protein [Gemmatimonadaceae bacterium]|nr:serine hydrolase domain-containing protein [Gemmatimonadaceae bacterium]